MDKSCNSCKRKISDSEGSVTFKCPSCLEGEINRCSHCRSIAAKYTCGCGFVGPN